MNAELFPELVCTAPDPIPEPCEWPLFVLAYYPKQGHWAVKLALQYADPNSESLQHEIKYLQQSGWTHITIMRLPPGGPWSP